VALFDALAPTYDDDFTRSPIARHLRARVHARLDALVSPGEAALELGCGTGEDALHLAQRGVQITATDASPLMRDMARAKLAGYTNARITHLDLQELNHRGTENTEGDSISRQPSIVSFQPSAFSQPPIPNTQYLIPNTQPSALSPQSFSLAYANFGVINCLSDWQPLAVWLAGQVRLGGRVAFGVMSPYCLWETAWHGLHGDWQVATRRWRKQGAAFSGQPSGISHQVSALSYQPSAISQPPIANSLIHYPAIARLTHDFAPYFRRVHVEPLGVFLPPSDVYGVLEKRPRLLRLLMALDKRIGQARKLALFADHYWIEFARTSG
jgi:SAM-dependent methyltransferase